MEKRDTSSIRQGEEINTSALENYLRTNLSPLLNGIALDGEIEIEQFPGGHSNLTYLIRWNNKEFVLRRPPVGPVAPTAHDMPREFKLLSMINPAFSLAPRPYLLCEDSSIIGVPFYIMERRKGLVIRNQVPEEIGEDLEKRRAVSQTMVNTLVTLHSVDIYQTGIVNIGKPAGFVIRQVKGWSERWQRSRTGELAEMDEVIEWINSSIPMETENSRATLVHNDFKLDNVMLDYHDPSKAIAVLDWEMCSVGDPLIDLGIFLCYWVQRFDPGPQGKSLGYATNGPGWLKREEIIDLYAEKTGRDLSQIIFYETFALFKLAVVLQQIYYRFVQGQTKDKRFQHFDHLVKELAKAALQLLKSSGS